MKNFKINNFKINLVILIIIFSLANFNKTNSFNRVNQNIAQTKILQRFNKPITYSQSSMKCFLRHIYNHNNYGQKFLAHNMFHIANFLSYTNNNSNSTTARSYIKAVLRLFNQKIKTNLYINAYAFGQALENIMPYIHDYLVPELNKTEKLTSIKNTVYNYLLNNFEELKENPDQALQNLSGEILDNIEPMQSEFTELKFCFLNFLETCISKLIWSAEDQKESWELVKFISNKLESLAEHNIITLDELNDLYWTLISRFAYFVELNATELSDDFYSNMLTDLKSNKLALYLLEEVESYITPKIQYLYKIIIKAQVASKAYQKGLISNY